MRGLTLIEVIVVIAIVGILIGFATIQFVSLMQDAKLTEQRDLLISEIEDVKLKSLTGFPHGMTLPSAASFNKVRLRDGTCSVTVATTCGANTDCPAGETCEIGSANFVRDTGELFTILSIISLSSPVKLSMTDTTELWFDRKGIPRGNGWLIGNRTFRIWYDSDNDNLLDAGEKNKEVVISSAGRIQYE